MLKRECPLVLMFAAMLFSEVFLDSTLLGFSTIDAWIAESQVIIVPVGTRKCCGPIEGPIVMERCPCSSRAHPLCP